MIKFQIIIDRKGSKKTIKPFLSKTVSSLALIFSVVVLSTIIGLGIHLVLAYTNPTADPPGDNVEGPINVSTTEQTKTGSLKVLDAAQKDNNLWELDDEGNVFGVNVHAPFGGVVGKNVMSMEKMWAQDLLQVDGEIYAPSQNREHEQACTDGTACKGSGPNSAAIICPSGKFLFEIHIANDGKSSYGYCAAPFKKYDAPVGGGGGSDIDDAHDQALESAPGAWDSVWDPNWWFISAF